jgi:hypothetical protein
MFSEGLSSLVAPAMESITSFKAIGFRAQKNPAEVICGGFFELPFQGHSLCLGTASHRLFTLALPLEGRLFVKAALLDILRDALLLHLALEDFKRLFNVVAVDLYNHEAPFWSKLKTGNRSPVRLPKDPHTMP